MRNGNIQQDTLIDKGAGVLTVPMRNGNILKTTSPSPFSKSSYRTYEEWKLSTWYCCQLGMKVLTVPMRNGNFHSKQRRRKSYQCSYRTYEEWKQSKSQIMKIEFFVLTVPMRNGNQITLVNDGRFAKKFLPYL